MTESVIVKLQNNLPLMQNSEKANLNELKQKKSSSIFITNTNSLNKQFENNQKSRKNNFNSIMLLSNNLFRQNLKFLHLKEELIKTKCKKEERAMRKTTILSEKAKVKQGSFLKENKKMAIKELTNFVSLSKRIQKASTRIFVKQISDPFFPVKLTSEKNMQSEGEIKSKNLLTLKTIEKKLTKVNFSDYYYLYRMVLKSNSLFSVQTRKVIKLPKEESQFAIFWTFEEVEKMYTSQKRMKKTKKNVNDLKRPMSIGRKSKKNAIKPDRHLFAIIGQENAKEAENDDLLPMLMITKGEPADGMESPESIDRKSPDVFLYKMLSIKKLRREKSRSTSMNTEEGYTSRWIRLVDNLLLTDNLNNVSLLVA